MHRIVVADPFRNRLAIVVAGGALLRLVRWVLVKWDQPLLFNDSIKYSIWARELLQGRFFMELFQDGPSAEHGPLTSLLLAPLSWGDDAVRWQRLGTVLIGVATVAAIGVLGRRVGGDRVGLAAAGVAAVYPNLWVNDGLVMSEAPAALLAVLTLIALVGRSDAHSAFPSARRAAAVGVLLGLGALTRSELALLVPLAALFIVWRGGGGEGRDATPWPLRAGRALLVVAAAAGTIAPWTIVNATRFDRPVLLTTNDGTTLIGAYCDETFEGQHAGGWLIFCVTEHPTFEVEGDPSVRSAAQRNAALQYARDRAGDLPEVFARRVARTFDLLAIDDVVHQDLGEERELWVVRSGIATFWLLAPLAALGALLLARNGPRARDALAVLAMPVLVTVVVSAAFYGAHRFRTISEPTVVVLAAVAAVAVWPALTRPLSDRRRSAASRGPRG